MKTFRLDLESVIEAEIFAGILDEERIPHVVVSYQDLAYDGLFQLSRGWGHVEIPEEYREKAEKLFRDFKYSLNASADAGMAGTNACMMDSVTDSACHGPDAPDAPAVDFRIEEVDAMFDQDLITAVMTQTGADRDTAQAALKTSDGNVDIAVRIIRSYKLREEAVPGGETAEGTPSGAWNEKAGETAGYGFTGSTRAPDEAGKAGEESAGSDWTAGTAGATEAGGETGQQEGKWGDNFVPRAQEVIDAIKDIIRKGNASRLDIEKGGKVVLSLSLTVGTIGLAIAPVAALIGLGAALITEYTIKVTLDNGTVINVNEIALMRRRSTETREPHEPKE